MQISMRSMVVILGVLILAIGVHAAESLTLAAVQPHDVVQVPESTEKSSVRFLKACMAELGRHNLPATEAECEKWVIRSHLIQSDAIRYLSQASDKDRQVFGAASTMVRYDILEAAANPEVLISLLLQEKETPNARLVVQLAKDVMKSSCGYYQIEVLLKSIEVANAELLVPRPSARKPARLAYKSCVVDVSADGSAAECLNPIFQSVTSEPSPNP